MIPESLRREPFRILFPLGVLLAWVAVLPWVLFGSGVIRLWLGAYHALTMTEGFIVAMAVGFLGTMLPRRTNAPPLSSAELGLIVVALVAVPLCLIRGQLAGAQLAYLAVLGTLVRFALRGVRSAGRPPHPSFVFLPLALAAGMAGACLVAIGWWRVPVLIGPGRALVEEGLLTALVLAVAPMLTSIIAHDRPPPPLPEARDRRERALHLAAGLLFLGSFALQFTLSQRAGMLLRGSVVAAELLLASQLWRRPSVPGLHRRFYWLALVFVPLGTLMAGARPAFRVPFLHLTFVGGLSMLVFAVSFHVVFLHTGNGALARRRPWSVAVVGGLALLATFARACAEHFGDHYVQALALASSLWLVGALVWGAVLLRLLTRARASA